MNDLSKDERKALIAQMLATLAGNLADAEHLEINFHNEIVEVPTPPGGSDEWVYRAYTGHHSATFEWYTPVIK